ncbi:MAG: folate-binding protein [Rhodobacteraceae bacterium]|jgi:folate-binding protein YgfZ|nr:folate-binding protein [Paracoccaceae bacterium]NCV29809.1 folate-binding protein [Paracoccaceae bacterium]NCV66669.1 folate-binding protein [Paracoccaceae bacterium]NCW03863.1 folate-binding protein [Paracoccaceae bacterium]NCW60864.1 folate-binding protein [Paracoccaceae bacterium]
MQRKVFRFSGTDARKFLQNLITNDIKRLDTGPVYSALLTPQGKFIADFFLIPDGNDILMDVDTDAAAPLIPRLNMYKLRADVTISETNLIVSRGLNDAPEGAVADPRDANLGWRYYGAEDHNTDTVDWDVLRVDHKIPEMGRELDAESYILEMGFEGLNGVDFRKGCYVGQEVTARMKHKTELRKGLVRLVSDADIPENADVVSNGKVIGRTHTSAGKRALAYLRYDRVDGDISVNDIPVTWQK